MKKNIYLLVCLSLCFLSACTRTMNVSDDPRYAPIIGQYRKTERPFLIYAEVENVYRAPGVFYKLGVPSDRSIIDTYGNDETFAADVPVGTNYKVIRVVRRVDASGRWDYLIGELRVPQRKDELTFRFHLGKAGATGRLKRDFP